VASILPIDVRALYDAGKRLKQDRDQPVRLAVLVEIDAPDELVEASREALHAKTASGYVDVSVLEPGFILRVDSKADAAIVLVGSGTHVRETLRDLHQRAVPTAVVALREPGSDLARRLEHPDNDTLTGMDPRELIAGPLADWLMSRLEKLRTAIGHNFEFARRAVAKETVKATAWQNAAIGVLVFLPGADMPLMTLNQGKMLLRIAAAYGQPLDTERMKELAAIVGGGFLFRTIAREAADFVPVLGWAVKGGIAYTGTIAMGMAAIKYFEEGGDISGMAKEFGEFAENVVVQAAAHAPHLHHAPLAFDESLEAQMGPGDVPEPEPRPVAALRPVACADAAAGPGQVSLVDVPAPKPTLTVVDDGREGAGSPS
jgi:uncharacterized protein (DUF697 family)